MKNLFTLLFLVTPLALMALPDGVDHKVYDGRGRVFYTGRLPKTWTSAVPVSKEFFLREGNYPRTLNRDVSKLTPVLDQGQCGSCVYFAVTHTWLDTMVLRGMPAIATSPQYLMDCAERRWMCGGSLFEYVAAGLVAKGGAPLMVDYPYEASNQSCQGSPKLYGKVLSAKLIDNSQKSIVASLNDVRTVATTIGAGGAWMNYRSGTFTQCSSIGTNHQVEIVDYDCETSVDASGNCVFDSNGYLPKGVGRWRIKNSWGMWGDKGFVWMKMTTSSGARCNNVTEEAGIIDVGDPLPPPGPQVFTMETPSVSLTVTLSSDAKATVVQARGIIQPFLDNWK